MNDRNVLVLASSSPRRRELLGTSGIPFTIDAPEVDEHCALPPREAVLEISLRKARAAAARHPGQPVLAADTLVDAGGEALGKPRDAEDAARMLRLLSGSWHQVHTGVAAIGADGAEHRGADTTDVHFAPMTEAEIEAYVRTGECMDKAGAYAVQGTAGLWIDRIEGSFSNVIGLPMDLTRRLLAACGVRVLPGERDDQTM